jgi:hypothetical protein
MLPQPGFDEVNQLAARHGVQLDPLAVLRRGIRTGQKSR